MIFLTHSSSFTTLVILQFEYVADVLDIIPQFHPELTISTVSQLSRRFNELLDAEIVRLLHEGAMHLEPLNRIKLRGFLEKYAPYQLVHDRSHKGKLNFPSRIIYSLFYNFQAANFIKMADEMKGKTIEESLTEIIVVRGKSSDQHILQHDDIVH